MPPDALNVTINLEREEAYALEGLLTQRPTPCFECPHDEAELIDDGAWDLVIRAPLGRLLLKLRAAL